MGLVMAERASHKLSLYCAIPFRQFFPDDFKKTAFR